MVRYVCALFSVDWSELDQCNKDSECTAKYGNVKTKCSPVKDQAHKGVCVPDVCEDDSDCPDVGDGCFGGLLEGRCDTNMHTCQYSPFILLAHCIQD